MECQRRLDASGVKLHGLHRQVDGTAANRHPKRLDRLIAEGRAPPDQHLAAGALPDRRTAHHAGQVSLVEREGLEPSTPAL
jgi:hypothetical protein